MISSSLKKLLIEQGFRAPSVHNVQPWVLDVRDENILVYDDLTRTLSIGDASLHDHEVSLGALIEGLHLLLSTENLGVTEIAPLTESSVNFQERKLRPRYRLNIANGFKADPLAAMISKRKSYRGNFLANTAEDRKHLTDAVTTDSSAVISNPLELRQWAKDYDRCSIESNGHRPLQAELYQWMRFEKSEANYQRDGLNAESLGISAIEAWAAKFLLRPDVYAFLNKFGMAGSLISEASQIASATGLLVIFKVPGLTPLENGRNFYRLWLQLTEAGFNACPLSALVDHPEGRKKIESYFGDKPVLNVLRVGKAPQEGVYESPRLPVQETLMGVQS
ncbi:MAG: hypothetical protein J7501_14965 [Bdellovibrio sp.]|nr:hypothetical protein [Bdellovibrio sp.]